MTSQEACPFKNLFKDLLKDLGVSEEKLQATETRLNALENKMQEVLSRLANSEAQIEKIKMENSGLNFTSEMTSQEDTVLQNEAQQLTCPFKNLFKDLLKDLGVSEEKLQATETRLNALENKMQEVLSRLANSEAQIEKIKMENSVIVRFCLPPDAKVIYKDATGTEVDAEIFSDLIGQGNVVLKVFTNDEFSDSFSSEMSDSSSGSSASTVIIDEVPNKRQRTEEAYSLSAKQVEQDFTLPFDEETSSRLLQKWDTFFKPNVRKEAKRLTSTAELSQLLLSAERPQGSDLDETSSLYNQEMSSLLLLINLLPPPPGGLKSPKISACDAAERLVVFHKA
ncbi:hypothetical protein ROHU_032174 [Labeo rohita]|uniref:Uncharacterized protein n=1 Tax=Labeo rohita TaxID=84645 RepID=A0A498LHS5_LABRO|nr:hypothetical protein ROHU_032174 [Labeo rohita]